MKENKTYKAVFVQIYEYMGIEAENEDDTYRKAKEEFDSDMCKPIARTWADFYEVAEENEDYEDFTL